MMSNENFVIGATSFTEIERATSVRCHGEFYMVSNERNNEDHWNPIGSLLERFSSIMTWLYARRPLLG